MQSCVLWARRLARRWYRAPTVYVGGFFVIVMLLAIPQIARASQPTVQSPTGPQSNGSFTGTYSFATYISCNSGVSYGDSYSNGLDGTHNFYFYGSLDGSLLVRIDGGGYQLINSCGDPFTGSRTLVASYSVSKNVVASTPAPTPVPTPVPTSAPTPPPAGGSSSGTGGTSQGGASSSGGQAAGGTSSSGSKATTGAAGNAAAAKVGTSTTAAKGSDSGQTATPAAGQPEATPAVNTAVTSTAGTPSAGSITKSSGKTGSVAPAVARPAAHGGNVFGASRTAVIWGLVLASAIAAAVIAWRQTAVRYQLADLWLGLKIILEPRLFRLRLWLRSRTRGHAEPRRRFVGRHAHTGRLLAHHHTNYGHLGVILLMATVAVSVTSVASRADISGSTNVSLTVQGPPPTTAPTITVPSDGDEMPSDTATIRGECEAGLFVGIYRNTVGAGSVVCPPSGVYAVLISLVDGDNELVAYNADALGQKGPASNPVVVHYTAPPPPTPTPVPSVRPTPVVTLRPSVTPGAPSTAAPTLRATPRPSGSPTVPSTKPTPSAPYYLATDNLFYQGATTGEPVGLPVRIAGGRAPYQVTWDWGNGSSSAMFVATSPVTGTYTYDAPGTYRLTVTAIDASGRRALVTVAIVVSGDPVVSVATTSDGRGQWHGFLDGSLLIAWPVLIMAILAVGCFWLGERRELRHRRRLIDPAPAHMPPLGQA